MRTRRLAQERLLSGIRVFLFPLAICLVLMGLGASARALEVQVSYSFPQVGVQVPPPASLSEGSIVATFTGDEPISLVSATSDLQQVDSNVWTCLFPWDWTEEVSASFVGITEDTVIVVASAQPVIPFGSESHQLPTFHITTERASLWDPATGIYVYGDFANFLQHGVEWEHPAHLDFFNPGDETAFSEPIGLRLNGGWSRRFAQKGFRFYFDDFGTTQEINYDFFDGTPTNFQRLIMRTHLLPFLCFNSDLVESIWLDQGHLGSRIQPVVAYVNHEYWGVYSLRERLDDEFLEVTHGIEHGSYIFIKDGIVERGDPTDWANLITSFSQPQDFSSHTWFVDISSKLDLPTYVDWLLLNIFSASADNGFDGNLAQLKQGDGPWQFIIWDEDDTFFPQNQNANMFRFYSSADRTAFEANWPPVFYYDGWDPSLQAWCDMFRGLMQNSEFKAFFFDRLDELLATELKPEAIALRVDAMVDEQEAEMDLHAQRYNWNSSSEFAGYADYLKGWVTARHGIIQAQAASFREEFRVPLELVNFQATTESDGVHLTWDTRGEQYNLGFVLLRESPEDGDPIVVDGYFNNPDIRGQGTTDELFTYSTIDHKPTGGAINHYSLVWVDNTLLATELPWNESIWVSGVDGLVFNELMAENRSTLADSAGQFDDWLELFNDSETTVMLDSFYITNDLTIPRQHRFQGNLQLNPGEHLLLWADGSPEQGLNHLNFQLSAAGSGIFLFSPDGQTLLTAVEFGQQIADVSWAREDDGSSEWVYSAVPTPSGVNGNPQTQSLLRLNEFMEANSGQPQDEMGEPDPWLEIYNPLPVPIHLAGLQLQLAGYTQGIWSFQNQEILPGHQLLWLDGQPGQGEFHAPFVLYPGSGSLALEFGDSLDQIDFLTWRDFAPVGSLARVPDGVGDWTNGVAPTPGTANPQSMLTYSLCVNEFMAMNNSVVSDETGSFADWVEIFNYGVETVSLSGMFLTDDLNQTMRWAFPDTVIGPGEFLIVWCDNDTLDGPLHATFKLSSSGESIALFSSVATGNMLIDGYTFGVQQSDISEGCIVDGVSDWTFFELPTPGYTNCSTSAELPPVNMDEGFQQIYPNPFNPRTTIVYALGQPGNVALTVHDVRGRLVTTLVNKWCSAGEHRTVWNGTSDQGLPMASGVYLVRIKKDSLYDSQRMILLR